MRHRPLVVLASVLIPSSLTLLAYSQATPSSQSIPVPLSDLNERGVAGRLGPRLGTIIHVAGVMVVNESRLKGDASEPFFVRVERVEGHDLDTPAIYPSTSMRLIDAVPGLKVGDHFKCIGYETGEFDGSPDGEFEHVPSYATDAFSFRTRFVVLKAD